MASSSIRRLTVAACFLAVAASAQQPAAPSQPLLAGVQRPPGIYADVQTNKGLIVLQLKPQYAPMAVANFVGLAEGTIDNAALDPNVPYFDGTTWHRVVPGHVIQTGIPKNGHANGPGYSFPNEIDVHMSHNHAGAVNMANSGPGTNGSQWCITLGDRSYLDGDFTVFGEVVEGLDVVFQIVQGDTIRTVRIERVGDAAQAFHPTTASFQAMVTAAKARAAVQDQLKAKAEQAWIAQNYPQATATAAGVWVQRLPPAPADSAANSLPADAPSTPAAAPALTVVYTGQELRYAADWGGYEGPPLKSTAFASGDNGVPGFHPQPIAFRYEPGKTRLNAGLDSVLDKLQPGDRAIVIVPAAAGYGRAGLYPPEVKGQQRFVVSPFALLQYSVEVLPAAPPPPARQP